MSEMLFSVFFARRLQAKRCFLRFLHFAYERNAVFNVFRSSLTSETLFLAISAFRSRATNDFLHFWLSKGWEMQPVAFFDFPKFGKVIFRCFSVFPMLGRPFSSVFRSFQVWESRFSLFFSFPKFGAVEHHLFFHGTNENVFDFKALGIGVCCFYSSKSSVSSKPNKIGSTKESSARRSFLVGLPVPRARSIKPLMRLISSNSYCLASVTFS